MCTIEFTQSLANSASHLSGQSGSRGRDLRVSAHLASADNMIMSLWKLDDTATQELFTKLLHYPGKGKQTITPSFQKAQLKLKTKYNILIIEGI